MAAGGDAAVEAKAAAERAKAAKVTEVTGSAVRVRWRRWDVGGGDGGEEGGRAGAPQSGARGGDRLGGQISPAGEIMDELVRLRYGVFYL